LLFSRFFPIFSPFYLALLFAAVVVAVDDRRMRSDLGQVSAAAAVLAESAYVWAWAAAAVAAMLALLIEEEPLHPMHLDLN
jgi:hypothetical protein